jgi:predicted nucleic acid-binding protein
VDLISVLRGFNAALVSADAETARRVARFSQIADTSLADRFALATADALTGRLHTTDRVLAAVARRARIPVTLY